MATKAKLQLLIVPVLWGMLAALAGGFALSAIDAPAAAGYVQVTVILCAIAWRHGVAIRRASTT